MDGERSGRVLLTLAEVAARLNLTEKAVRRRLERGSLSGLRVVRVGRSVRVDGEDLESWICRKGEIGGARERATRSMHISAPPYKHDPTRRHVSIILEHPRTHATIRKRLVTSFACDEAGGLTWGRQQALDMLERLMVGESDPVTPDNTRAKPRDPTPAPQAVTLAEIWTVFSAERSRLRPGTLRVDEARWRTRIKPLLGDLQVTAIGRHEIMRVRASLASNDAHYANQVLSLLRRMLEYAAEHDMLEEAPAVRSERKSKKPKLVVPDEEDLDVLITTAERLTAAGRYAGTDLALMIMLGLDAGLRPGEIAGLRWCDVDLRRSRIIVRNTRASAGNSDLPPKAGDAGTVHLTDRLRDRLATVQRRTHGKGTTYVCLQADGGPLFTVLVSMRVRDIHEAAGVPIKRAHWLRHCAASRLINQGGTLEETKDFLRHHDLGVTQRYVHEIEGHDPGPGAAMKLNERNRRSPAPATAPRRGGGKKMASGGN